MIDEHRTLELFGYTSDKLKTHSGKKVVVVCDDCGTYRVTQKDQYHPLCHWCSTHTPSFRKKKSQELKGRVCSEETRKKISDSKRGHEVSIKTRQLLSESSRGRTHSKEARIKIGEAVKGRTCSDETRRRVSASHQGISYDEWESFARDQPYCPKFNEACRESNREKYDRRCFLCWATEKDNGPRLSVHHIDMNKAQGCDGQAWKLVPLCRACHARAHTTTWSNRLVYLLENVRVRG